MDGRAFRCHHRQAARVPQTALSNSAQNHACALAAKPLRADSTAINHIGQSMILGAMKSWVSSKAPCRWARASLEFRPISGAHKRIDLMVRRARNCGVGPHINVKVLSESGDQTRSPGPLLSSAALIALCLIVCAQSKAGEFSVPFKPLKHDVLATEILWQTENVVDIQQTLRISREPGSYREIGELGWFTGQHPQPRQVWVGLVAFGIVHYMVTEALTAARWDNAARIWTYSTLAGKTRNMASNARLGLGY